MPRRIAEYAATDGYTTLNRISSAGAVLLFISVALFARQLLGLVAETDPRRRQPVGRRHPRMGDDLSATASQLPEHPAGPL